ATPQTPLFLTTRRDRADFPSCGVVASLLGHYPTASAPPCLRGNLPRSRPRGILRQATDCSPHGESTNKWAWLGGAGRRLSGLFRRRCPGAGGDGAAARPLVPSTDLRRAVGRRRSRDCAH